MVTDTWKAINQFILHVNDAVLLLCLNNQQRYPDKTMYYDKTQLNTQQVFEQLEQQLDICKVHIDAKTTTHNAQLITMAISIYADEIILTSGLYYSGYLWPKLQKKYIGNQDGGNVFFQMIDEYLTLDEEARSPFVLKLFHYCLKNGFKGRHYNNQQALSFYDKRLSDQLENKKKPKQAHDIVSKFHYAK